MIVNIMDAAKDVDNRATVAQSQFRNRTLAICTTQYPQIGQLPVPIQKLLAVELDAVVERIVNGEEVPTGYDEALRAIASSIGDTYFHADISFSLILKSKC